MANSTLSTAVPSPGLPYYSQLELIQDLCARTWQIEIEFQVYARFLIHTLELKLWHFEVYHACMRKPCNIVLRGGGVAHAHTHTHT